MHAYFNICLIWDYFLPSEGTEKEGKGSLMASCVAQ